MNSSEALKPCPFCGGGVVGIVNVGERFGGRCKSCYTDGPTHPHLHGATVLWNTRTPSKAEEDGAGLLLEKSFRLIRSDRLAAYYVSKPEIGTMDVVPLADAKEALSLIRTSLAQAEQRVRKCDAALNAVQDMGVYPAAIVGGEAPYEKRTERMEGWNDAVMEMHRLITASISAQAEKV